MGQFAMPTAPKKKAGRPAKAAAEKAETFSVRLHPDMRARLEEAAAKAGRSLAAEISARLDASFSTPLTFQLIERRLDEIQRLVREYNSLEDLHGSLVWSLEYFIGKTDDPSVRERIKVQDEADRVVRRGAEVRVQLSRVEKEARELIDDIGRQVDSELELMRGPFG